MRHLTHRLQPLAAAMLLAAAVPGAWAQPQPEGTEQSRHYDIPAGSLGQALTTLAEQAGVALAFDPQLTLQQRTSGVKGHYPLDQAFYYLLQGTGLQAQRDERGRYVLSRLSSEVGIIDLDETMISQQPLELSGYSLMTREKIANTPAINATLTDVLSRLPGVTTSGRSRSSMGNGEITPDNISIHGARFFQNQFLLDGASINNDLDPSYDDPGDLKRLASHGQGYFVDLGAVESITVHDHNISAQHGGFTGGVVDVETRRYGGDNRYELSWRHTSDSLSEFHVDPGLKQSFEGATLAAGSAYTPNQPKFRKDFFTLGADIGHGEHWGTVLNIAHKYSDIPLFDQYPMIYEVDDAGVLQSRPNDGPKVNQYRESLNLTSKTSYQPGDGQVLDINLRYGSHKSRLSLGASSNSGFTNYHDGYGLGIRYERQTHFGSWRINSNYDAFSDERKIAVERPELLVLMTNDRNYNSGVPGPLEREQKTLSFKPSLSFNEFAWLGTRHLFQAGADISHVDMQEARKVRAREYSWRCGLTWPSVCYEASDLNLFTRYNRVPYSLDLTQRQYALWAEHLITVGRFTARPGLRIERNSFLGNTDIAPRLSMAYDLFGDGRTQLKAGANRYYGRSFMELEASRIRDLSVQSELFLVPGQPPYVSWGTTNWEQLDNAKTPYDDEMAVGIAHLLGRWQLNLDWVHRNGRDQFSTEQFLAPTRNRFGNEGKSETDTVTLRIGNQKPWHLLSTDWSLTWLMSWQESRSNARRLRPGSSSGYNEIIGSGAYGVTDTSRVILDGKVIALEELPTDSFNTPWRGSLDLGARWPQLGLSWNNFLDIRAPYTAINSLGRQGVAGTNDVLNAYEKVRYSTRSNWDMQLRWESKQPRVNTYVQLDMLNVLNDTNLASTEGGTRYYEIGRQYWVEVGLRF